MTLIGEWTLLTMEYVFIEWNPVAFRGLAGVEGSHPPNGIFDVEEGFTVLTVCPFENLIHFIKCIIHTLV